jgi:hypothetical protein
VVIAQDFRSRSIHWIVIPLLAVTSIIWRITFVTSSWTDVIFNWVILVFQAIALILYFSFKNRKWINPLDTMIGLGDLLYFVCLAIAFPTLVFIAFMVSGFVFALLSYSAYRLFTRESKAEIPLAGLMSVWMLIALVVLIATNHLSWIQDDSFLLEFLCM